jgi:tight adherence protein C
VSFLLAVGLLAVFAALALALITLVLQTPGNPQMTKVLAHVEAMRPPSSREIRQRQLETPFGDRVLDPVVRHFVGVGHRLLPDEQVQQIRRRLDLAGNPPGWDADRVVGLKALCCLIGIVLGMLVPPLFGVGVLPTVALLLVGAALGWFGPDLYLYQVGYDRAERIRRDLPDALDLMTISVEAGLAFDAALSHVARRTEGPLAKEFMRVLQEMQIGTGRREAMRAMGERTDVPELRSFLGSMVQADEFGIPIASVLRVQAAEMRVKRSQRAEELAQKVPVKILFPLIFCIMPCLFIVVMGPAAITMIQNFAGRGR